MRNLTERSRLLHELLRERILVLDGAMGTMLQQAQLTAADFGGADLEGCNENLVLTRPDVISSIHRQYFEAGADIVETNTFGSTSIVLAEYGLAQKAYEISRAAGALARAVADELASSGKPRFVAGSMGPTTKSLTVTGGTTFTELRDSYHEQARGLIDGGADILLLETCQDTRNIKAGVLAIQQLSREIGQPIPLMISATIEADGHHARGPRRGSAMGFARSPGLALAGAELRHRAGVHDGSHPHARKPDAAIRFVLSERGPAERGRPVSGNAPTLSRAARALCRQRLAEHRRRLLRHHARAHSHDRADCGGQDRRGSPPAPSHRAVYSGIEMVEAEESTRPLLVGERTNVIGSRLFKNLVAEEKWEEATEIGRRQVRSGAHIVDVCLQSTEREEMERYSRRFTRS